MILCVIYGLLSSCLVHFLISLLPHEYSVVGLDRFWLVLKNVYDDELINFR